MPLNYQKPKFRLASRLSQIKNATLQFFAFVNPNILIMIFLIVAILLAFLKIESISFHFVFGIFIIGYFGERIVKIWQKKKITNTT